MNRILRATASLGASSLVTIALSTLRYKFIALDLGANGLGLLGLLSTALSTLLVLFGLGLGNAGIRFIAVSKDEDEDVARARRHGLLWGSAALSLLGALAVAGAAPLIGPHLLPGTSSTQLTLWLAVTLGVSILAAGVLALLNGLERLSLVARANALGALLGTAVFLGLLWALPGQALAAAFVAPPLFTLLVALVYAAPYVRGRSAPREAWIALVPMIRLGVPFALSLLAGTAAQYASRLLVERRLGLEEVGHMQAAWTVANVYLGFVLGAMGSEYFPRLSRAAAQVTQLNVMVRQQIRLVLLLGGPVLLLLIAFAPLIIGVLYAPSFASAVTVLRWQAVGDLAKLVSWAVAFVLLARENRRAYLVVELLWSAVFLGALAVLVAPFGLQAVGLAYLLAYLAYMIATLVACRAETGFALDARATTFVVGAAACAVLNWWLAGLGLVGQLAGALVAVGLLVAGLSLFGWWGGVRQVVARGRIPGARVPASKE
ncbi:oligosaccharide flippase family protein [Deinococcus pimensis]|uniref:oligosaccharide flippase family protein n=1 Tax=Deinococcus pimensis TaxID=309888 RepID=UPI00047F72C0|nr:oligosaccharide flippase family protein [Deinococcus pimensis]